MNAARINGYGDIMENELLIMSNAQIGNL